MHAWWGTAGQEGRKGSDFCGVTILNEIQSVVYPVKNSDYWAGKQRKREADGKGKNETELRNHCGQVNHALPHALHLLRRKLRLAVRTTVSGRTEARIELTGLPIQCIVRLSTAS